MRLSVLPTVLAVPVLVAGPALPVAAAPPAPTRPIGTVTLITGDRVSVAAGQVRVHPAPGRAGNSLRETIGGDLFVVPYDAVPLIAAGRLDGRLFDVSRLLRAGRGGADHSSVRLPISAATDTGGVQVTIRAIDGNGAPASDYFVAMTDVATGEIYVAAEPSGPADLHVPAGVYYVEGDVITADPEAPRGIDITNVVEPNLVVSSDSAFTMDARDGRAVGAVPDRAGAGSYDAVVSSLRTTAFGDIGSTLVGPNVDHLSWVPSTTRAPRATFHFDVEQAWARPSGSRGFANSPWIYHLGWTAVGAVPRGLVRHFADADLGYAYTRHADVPAGQHDQREQVVSPPPRLKVYCTPGRRFASSDLLRSSTGAVDVDQEEVPRTCRVGRNPDDRWDYGVLGPSFPRLPHFVWAGRDGDEIGGQLPLYSDDNPDHWGQIAYDRAATRLYRNGHLVGTSPEVGASGFTVPAQPATFRLAAHGRQSVEPTSTDVSVSWTFRSGHTSTSTPLPLLAIRFAPRLDAGHFAAAGRLRVPVTVQRQRGAHLGRVRRLTVRVSYDDGETWRRRTVHRSGDRAWVVLSQPAGTRYVSLRARASDSTGATVTETIVRAYRVRGRRAISR